METIDWILDDGNTDLKEAMPDAEVLRVDVSSYVIDQYLVGFLIWAEISGMLKKNGLEKLVSPMK